MLTYHISTERSLKTGERGTPIARHNYLWLKKVTGFNPNVHCAKCLKGTFENDFGLRAATDRTISLKGWNEGDIGYACSVAKPYNWHRNGHLAFRVKAGAWCVLELWTGDAIKFDNAELIRFDGQAAAKLFVDKGPEFLTCRNYQFGAQFFGV